MRVRIQVVVESDQGDPPVVQEIAALERGPLQPDGLGLTLAEAKDLLRSVQETMAAHQVAEFVAGQERCPDCRRQRSRKGRHEIVYQTLFGKLRLDSPRLYACPCQPRDRASTSPLAELLPKRTAPELAYLETKFAALMSYGLTVDLLAEILPLGEGLNKTSVRRQVQRTAERTESELGAEQFSFIEGCQRDWDQLPRPGPPLTVGLDGGSVHALLKAVGEFHHSIETNQHSIPNSGDRYRHGETIATAFAESTVNQVISKRMVKEQQMCWTERGAHLLLQVRTQVLNDDLRATFERWYPGLKADPAPAEEVAA